jgi:hypothetical protein
MQCDGGTQATDAASDVQANQGRKGGARLREETTVRDCAGRKAQSAATIAAVRTMGAARKLAAAPENGA